MAKLSNKELSQMSVEQLKEKYIEIKKELMKLNMQRATGTPPENPGMIRASRRSIARINTYLTQKNIAKTKEVKPVEKQQTKSETKQEEKKAPVKKVMVKKSTKTEVKKKKE